MDEGSARDQRPWWRTTPARVTAGLVVLAVAVSPWLIGGDDEPAGTTPVEGAVTDPADADAGPVRLRLRQGDAVAQVEDPVAVVQGEPLPQARIDAVLDRLDPFAGEEGDRTEFNRPAESLPPPVAGETIETTFPPEPPGDQPPAPSQEPAGPLQVLRVQPEGEVDIAPSLSLTFDQPMIPLATLEQLDAAEVPVTVSPDLPGRWRWIGTRTLRLEHAADPAGPPIDRLPMATEYTVTVPAGTTSASGGTLAEAVSFTFATPPPTVVDVTPQDESLPLTPVFVVTFDQVVDPEAVLDHLTLDADGDRALRLATAAEIEADDVARPIADQALEGRWVAVRPVEPLPADTPLTLTVGAGTPSAEGPRTTTDDQSVTGRTYPPLRLVQADCGYGGGCRPGQPFVLTFSNPLDAAALDPSTVTVEPDLPGLRIQVQDTQLVVLGATAADTTYRVTVPAGLQDQRGQTLGQDETRELAVGDPRPFLRGFDRELVTLDPSAEVPSLSLVSAGHEQLRVVALQVDPGDYARYLDLPRYGDDVEVPDLPVLFDRLVDTGGAEDGDVVETIVDLSEAFPGGTGHAVLYVEPVRTFPPNSEAFYENLPVIVWAQATTVGIDAVDDRDRMVVWTTDLRDGSPIAGAQVDVGGQTATTDADGLATVELAGQGPAAITATVDGQTALLGAGYVGRWQAEPRRDVARWHVLDDRGLYRPGETVRVKGWVRRLALSDAADLVVPGGGATVTYQVLDGQYAEVATGEAQLNALGGFDLAVDLPAGANLGQGLVLLQLAGAPGLQDAFVEHPFQIQEFRRPEFEVTARAESPEPHVVTRPITVAATAAYLTGGGLPNAPVTWTVSQQDTTYRPPGWQDFSFGVSVPWWIGFGGHGGGFEGGGFEGGVIESDLCCPGVEPVVERFQGVTDASGRHHLQIEVEGGAPDQPLLISANAAVEDVNRQAVASTADLLVHAGERYLGLASDRAFVRGGDPLRIDAILTDIDGAAIDGEPVTLTLERLVEEVVDGELVETAVDPRTCELTSGTEPQRCELPTEVGGRHRISGVVRDADGGMNRTELEVWVSGGEAVPTRTVEQQQLTLIPAQQTYAVGETAEILVPAPFSPATGLVTITRAGIEQTQVVEVSGGSAIVEIPLTEDAVGGIGVQVDLVGSAPRLQDDGQPAPDLPARPAYATGATRIEVPPVTRTLTVEAVPREAAVEPGTSTAVDVAVTDADGQPVAGADLAVVVVDEAILSLIGYELADPVDSFYGDPGLFLSSEHLRRTLLLSRTDALTAEGLATASGGELEATEDEAAEESLDADDAATEAAAGGGDAAAPAAVAADGAREVAQADTPIEVRQDFDALAVFAPSVTTDAQGRATVDVDLPDSLTRYRVMAIAASGADRFGSGESTLTARLPLQVRPSAPRFANFGDAFELPVVLQNATDADLDADVVLETANLGTPVSGVAVTVPAGDRVEVRFPVSAEDAGTARFRVTGVSGDMADAAVGSLPVYTPTTTESFATYGVVDGTGGGASTVGQPLLTPQGVVPQFGGLEVTTSVTALQALTDAVLYLADYPYESADALASRLLAIAALRDVLAAFDAEGLPPPAEIEQVAADDIAGLVALQKDDGGWAVWQRLGPTEPYHTTQVTHALIAARDAGYAVPDDVLARAVERLRTIEQTFTPELTEAARLTLRAYAIHVRALAGDRDPAQAAAIHGALQDAVGEDGSLPLDALAWIWPVVDDPGIRAAIEQTFTTQVTETPSAATFTTGYGEDAHLVLGSDRRTDGIVLDAFLTQQPSSDLIPKIVNGLIANQRQGRWANVQENAFILLALKRYFDTFEAAAPDLVARVWLGDLYAAEHAYPGRTTDSTLTVIPTADLLDRQDPPLLLSADGVGRLYYRLALRTAPDDLVLDPRDEGFVVQREYAAVEDEGDVVRDPDGTWRIRAGAEVEVTLTMVADSRRVNMALVDPLPAGLEIVNPALAASPALPPPDGGEEGDDGRLPGIWRPTWFEHQNLRDDRAEAFAGWLEAGTYTYTYVARATTPGTFVVPPATAEEIYTPEVFGRSGTDTVVIAG